MKGKDVRKKVIKVNWLNVTRLDSNKLIISSFLFLQNLYFLLNYSVLM